MNAGDDIGTSPRPPLLAVEKLSKRFGDRRALDDVSFSVQAGTFTAVLGPSGVGKSTLFRCIAGLEKQDAGDIRIEDRNLNEIRQVERRRMAVVFQQFNLVRRLTALDNVLAGRLGYVSWWRGISRRFERADRLRALECLERVGLLDCARQRADTLSGGQQQRVAIARALAQEARLIVADEPVASLDPGSAVGILRLLRDIAKVDGVAVLSSLHQVAYARGFADRVIGMAAGRIVLDSGIRDLDETQLAGLYSTLASNSAGPPSEILGDGASLEQGVHHGTDGLAHSQG